MRVVARAVVTTTELLQVALGPSGKEDVLGALLGMVSWETRMLLDAW